MQQYGYLHRLVRKYKDKLRKYTIRIPSFLFGKKLAAKQIIPNGTKPASILFVLDDCGIGDCLVASIALKGLKAQLAGLRLDVIASPKVSDLLKAYPYIDNVYVASKRSSILYHKIGKALAANHYDMVIYLKPIYRLCEIALLRAVGSQYIVSGKTLDLASSSQPVRHVADGYANILRLLQLDAADLRYDIPSDPQREQQVADFLQQNQLKDYIAVNFWAGARVRTLTEDNIYLLMDNIASTYKDKQIVLLGFPAVAALVQKLKARYANTYSYDSTSILDSIALLRHAALVITPETSIVHIASGFDKPLITFYVKPNDVMWAPTATRQKLFAVPVEVNDLDFRNVDLKF